MKLFGLEILHEGKLGDLQDAYRELETWYKLRTEEVAKLRDELASSQTEVTNLRLSKHTMQDKLARSREALYNLRQQVTEAVENASQPY